MRTILKSSIALTLGAAVTLGSLAPSFAMGNAPLRGISQSGAESPMVLVRGGIRYQDLQDSRGGLDDSDNASLWQSEADEAPIQRLGTWDRGGRPMQFY